jgi:prolyl 4-hydroxylase
MTVVRAPRIAQSAFRKIRTPAALQEKIWAEYSAMKFQPTGGEAVYDPHYKAKQRAGISAQGEGEPDVGHAPASRELFDACYEILTPLIEEWAGCKLTRSWGYGIRSYGRGSVLHLHRDRVDTHVISCIIHVDDRSDTPWPLDFIDHEGELHHVTFARGETLFYESLCPHARLTPFAGEYYRNMYVHWRPENWEPETCRGMRSRYSSIEECLSEWQDQDSAAIATG